MIGRLRWVYLLYYAGVGTFLSYFAPYLRGLGFSGEQIGLVTFGQQVVAAPAALIWGSIADRLGAPSRALAVCTAGMLFATCGLPFARTPAVHIAVSTPFGTNEIFDVGTPRLTRFRTKASLTHTTERACAYMSSSRRSSIFNGM